LRGDTPLASGTAAELSDHETHESAAGRAEPAHSLGRIRLGLLLLAIGLALTTIFQNTEPTTVKVVGGSLTLPRWLLLALFFAAGNLSGFLIPKWHAHRKRTRHPHAD